MADIASDAHADDQLARRRKRRWLAALVATPAVLLLTYLVIRALGSRFHQLLAEAAGGLIGAVKDNVGVVVAASIACVVGAWLFIAAASWWQTRQEGGDNR